MDGLNKLLSKLFRKVAQNRATTLKLMRIIDFGPLEVAQQGRAVAQKATLVRRKAEISKTTEQKRNSALDLCGPPVNKVRNDRSYVG